MSFNYLDKVLLNSSTKEKCATTRSRYNRTNFYFIQKTWENYWLFPIRKNLMIKISWKYHEKIFQKQPFLLSTEKYYILSLWNEFSFQRYLQYERIYLGSIRDIIFAWMVNKLTPENNAIEARMAKWVWKVANDKWMGYYFTRKALIERLSCILVYLVI